MNVYKRVSIIGNSGAGKSTLSRQIGKLLDLDILTIDKIYWMPGWKIREQSSYKLLHEDWLTRDNWLIDGVGYWDELERRLSVSDFIIFYDVPVPICKQRARQRIIDEEKSPNPDIVEGCSYQEVQELQMSVIEHFEADVKPRVSELLTNLAPSKYRILKYGEETEFLIGLEQLLRSNTRK